MASESGHSSSAGGEIPELQLRPGLLVDRSIAIYGPSKTGKTVCVKAIMQAVVGHIEQVMVIAPSEPTNRSYDGFVDPTLIHYRPSIPEPPGGKRLTEKQASVQFLEAIWARQEMAASIYKRANQLGCLASLYARLPRPARVAGDSHLRTLHLKRERVMAAIDRKWARDAPMRDEKRSEAKEKFEKMLVLLYKNFLTPHVESLWGRSGLDEDEHYSLGYIHFNPRLLLIFDDCAAQLKPLLTTEIWRKLFYQNRHSYITLVLCCQDDTDLNTNLRKNAFISIFCEEIVCGSFFDRAANKFPKRTKQYVALNAPKILKGRQKLAYLREDPSGVHFYRLNPPSVRKCMFGSEALRELCGAVRANGSSMDQTNPYYDKFKL